MSKMNSVEDIDLGWRDLMTKVTKIQGMSVTAGLHDDAGQDNVNHGVWNEFGVPFNSPDKRIPSRPFLRDTVNEYQKQWIEKGVRILNRMITDGTLPNNELRNLGIRMTTDIKNKIREFDDPRNADSTIKQKGFDNPLIEDGNMLSAVNYKIEDDNVDIG